MEKRVLWSRFSKAALMKMKTAPSSGNVFRDLGFSREEAEHLKVRAILMLHVQEIVRGRRLRQTQAAKMLGVTQPRVSDLLRGRIDLFSTDTLIDMLTRLGAHVKLVAKTPRRTSTPPNIRVELGRVKY